MFPEALSSASSALAATRTSMVDSVASLLELAWFS
jgi:hypothetical protein